MGWVFGGRGDDAETPLRRAARQRAEDDVLAGRATLPDRERQVIELRYGEELSWPQIEQRTGIKYADHVSDKVVRGVQRQAEIADDKKNGKIGTALFPGGVTPIIRPVGNTQVIEMRALEGRIEAAGALWPGAMPEKAKIMAERIAYETALTERRTAMETAADLRAKRDAAREDFLDVYAATAARVKAEFPRDRAMQDLFFDRVTDAVVAEDAAADADEAPGAEGAVPGPATPGAAEPGPATPA